MSATRKTPVLLALWLMQACAAPTVTPAPVSPKAVSPTAPAQPLPQPLRLDPDGRIALATLERLDMVTSYEEASPGLLRLRLGNGWDKPAGEYHLSHLFSAYASHIEAGWPIVLELWQGNAKIGEYTSDGMLLGREFSRPR